MLRPLRIRVPDELMSKAKAGLGDLDASDTITVRHALAVLAGEDPSLWAVHHRPGPPKSAA
jgi:hypothetical protein